MKFVLDIVPSLPDPGRVREYQLFATELNKTKRIVPSKKRSVLFSQIFKQLLLACASRVETQAKVEAQAGKR